MLKETVEIIRKKAVVFEVDFGSELGVEGYAMAWLKLTNNAREYKDMIWKIENDRHSDKVYIYANPKSQKAVREFCNEIYIGYKEDKENNDFKTIPVGKVIREWEEQVGFMEYDYYSTVDSDDEEFERDMDKAVYEWMYVI